MRIFVKSRGRGPNLVMLHGWGLHSGIWEPVARALAGKFRITYIDLPGHGRSGWNNAVKSIDEYAEIIASVIPLRTHLLGWSLGGMIACVIAERHPTRIGRLVLTNTTPRFIKGDDWRCAMAADDLADLAARLADDYRVTVNRFLTLSVRGDERARTLLRDLRREVFRHGDPDQDALKTGLDLLRDTDLRSRLAAVTAETLIIAGEADTLTPAEASEWMARQLPNARYAGIGKAAHAPFISHTDEFMHELGAFLLSDRAVPGNAQ